MWIEQKCLGGKKGFVRSTIIYFSFGLFPLGIVGQTERRTLQSMYVKSFDFSFFSLSLFLSPTFVFAAGVSLFPGLICRISCSGRQPRMKEIVKSVHFNGEWSLVVCSRV